MIPDELLQNYVVATDVYPFFALYLNFIGFIITTDFAFFFLVAWGKTRSGLHARCTKIGTLVEENGKGQKMEMSMQSSDVVFRFGLFSAFSHGR